MKFGLSDKSLSTIAAIFSRYPAVTRAVVYGSRAKGNYRPGSDIDITLETTPDFTRETLLSICNDFDDSDLPYLADISQKSALTNPDLLAHIDRVGQTLWEKTPSGEHT